MCNVTKKCYLKNELYVFLNWGGSHVFVVFGSRDWVGYKDYWHCQSLGSTVNWFLHIARKKNLGFFIIICNKFLHVGHLLLFVLTYKRNRNICLPAQLSFFSFFF